MVHRVGSATAAGVTLLAALAGIGLLAEGRAVSDPLAAEIARLNAFLKDANDSSDIWADVRGVGEPVLARAETALRDGRRLLALHRLAAAREPLTAAAYVLSLEPGQRQEAARFEAEWRRVGRTLRKDLRRPAGNALRDLGPAVARAIGEAASMQVPVYYGASLDYGRATMNDAGLYYLGSALAQRDLVAFLRSLDEQPSAGDPPPLRGLSAELDALEADMLAVYRPPVSIDRHGEFIGASAALKEARELDAAGLRYGALLRYLLAAQRFAALRGAVVEPDASDVSDLDAHLSSFEQRLSVPGTDHTIGRVFLETAQALAHTGTETDTAIAQGIAADVLPRYFAALDPARPAAVRPDPRVTVTLEPLAVHVKSLRPGRSAGTERGAGDGERGRLRRRELRRLGAGAALRRHALSGDLRGRRARGDAEGLRVLRQG